MAGAVGYSTRKLDCEILVYDDRASFLSNFSRARPTPLHDAYFFMDKARALGVEVTFRAKGPDAGYAIKIVREVLDTPIETLERQFQQYTGWAAVWAKAQDSVR